LIKITINRIVSFVDSIVPEKIVNEDNYIDYYRQSFLVMGSILGIFATTIILIAQLNSSLYDIASVVIIIVALFGNFYFVKNNMTKIGAYFTAASIAFSPIAAILYDNHFLAKGFLWFLFVPFFLSIFINKKELLVNILLIVGVFIGLELYLKPKTDVLIAIQGEMVAIEYWQLFIIEFLAVLVAISVVSFCYKYVHEKNQTLIKKSRKSIQYHSKMSSLGEMAGNIAHEINNPLTVITGSAYKIKQTMKKELLNDEDKEVIFDSIKKISETVERVGDIVNALQNISRKSEQKKSKISLSEVLKEVISITSFKLKEKEIFFANNFQGEFLFIGDRVEMSQVVLNLINNAFYASEKNCESKVKIEFDEDECFGYLHIVDNGDGVPEENIERIFEPLFSTKPIGEGTGIGLAISSTMIKNMGGSIEYSRRNDLTYFTIKLPKFNELES
jgi:signal transduction histidine kinase